MRGVDLQTVPATRRKRGDELHPARVIWRGMLMRCGHVGVPRDSWIKYYISRGITVCEAWLDFSTFERWLYGQGWEPHKRLTVCRLNKTLGYTPENCRVMGQGEAQNYRSNVFRVNGVSIRDLLGVQGFGRSQRRDVQRASQRCRLYGWDGKDAVRVPLLSHDELRTGSKARTDTGFRQAFIAKHPLYRIWMGIPSRKACWDGYAAFESWALQHGWRPGMIVSRTGTANSPEAFRIVEAQAYYAGRRGTGGRFVKRGN